MTARQLAWLLCVASACTRGTDEPKPAPHIDIRAGLDPEPATGPPLVGLTDISAAAHHTCAIESGRVWCWGQNRAGQLGVGAALPESVTTPHRVRGFDELGPVVRIATDYDYSCALTHEGAIYCWGANDRHQLGQGDTTPRERPTRVSLAPAAELATSFVHACAIEAASRAVWCWGHDYAPTPIAAPKLSGVEQFVDTGSHACTLAAGAMLCWGDNRGGQIGNGEGGCEYDEPLCDDCKRLPDETCKHVEQPTAPLELPPIAAIAASPHFTYAIDRAGGVWQWGQVGQTMSFSPQPNYRPQRLELPPVTELSAGASHACARTREGELWCWGDDPFGQLGFESKPYESRHPQPRRVEGLPKVQRVAAGFYSTCALTGEAEHTLAWCWGDNGWGQIGDGTTERRHTPTQVRMR